MAELTPTNEMKPTLGLTGLTSNAMALIAPGAFLWLTFLSAIHDEEHRSGDVDGNRGRACALSSPQPSVTRRWPSSIPATGSSYYFAEQAFLSREQAHGSMPASRSSSSAGPRISTTGSIPASWSVPRASSAATSSALSGPTS
jgi:hypothetical protein